MDIKSLRKKINDLTSEFERLAENYGHQYLRELFKPVFEQFKDKVSSFKFQCYVPYFNDGEACSYSFRGLYVSLVNGNPEGGDSEDGWLYEYDDEVKEIPGLKKTLASLEKELSKDLGFLEKAFGSHAEVTIENDDNMPVTVEEYTDHD